MTCPGRQLTFGAGTQDGVFGWTATDSVNWSTLHWRAARERSGARVLRHNPIRSRRTQTWDSSRRLRILARTDTPSAGAGRLGNAPIWRVDTEGRKPEALVSGGTNGGPSCSPDGKWVYFNSPPYLSDVESSAGRRSGGSTHQISIHISARLAEREMDHPFLLLMPPGGHWDYSGHRRCCPSRRWIFPIPARRRCGDSLTPGGDGIDYVDTQDGISNIWRQPLSGESRKRVTHFSSGLIFNFAWMPHGRDMVIARHHRFATWRAFAISIPGKW